MRYFPEITFFVLIAIAFIFSYMTHDLIDGFLIFAVAVLVFYLFSYLTFPKEEGFVLELKYLMKVERGKFIELNVSLPKFFNFFKEYLGRNFVSFVNYSAFGDVEKFLKMREIKPKVSVLMPGEFKQLLKQKGGIIHSYVAVTYSNPLKSRSVDMVFRISDNAVISVTCRNIYITRLINEFLKK